MVREIQFVRGTHGRTQVTISFCVAVCRTLNVELVFECHIVYLDQL